MRLKLTSRVRQDGKDRVQVIRTWMERISCGIPELDEMMEGGLPRGGFILVVGNAGAGKSTFAPQYLHDGLTRFGEPGILCFNSARPGSSFLSNMRRFGMNFENSERQAKFIFLDPSRSHSLERKLTPGQRSNRYGETAENR